MSARTRTQLIVTTHSDALVSALTEHVESVLVCEYRGGTQLARLDAERLQHWLQQYRLVGAADCRSRSLVVGRGIA